MHDPMTVAHEINSPFKDKHGHRHPIITIWHVDPDIRGDDDSCGWFFRSRHIDPALLEKVRKEFEFNFKHNYWFTESGYPVFSVLGTTLEMYSKAAWIIFMHRNGDKGSSRARRQHRRFMKKYLFDILHFAENPTDSLWSSVTMKYGVEKKEDRISNFVSIIAADIMRKIRPWWKHPRWHIHHWKIQIPIWQRFRRRYFDRCSKCGKRGFGDGSAYSDWDGTMIWCESCNREIMKSPERILQ